MLAAKHIIKISKEEILVMKSILIVIKHTTSFSLTTVPPRLPENNKSHSGIEVPHKHYSTLIIGIIFLNTHQCQIFGISCTCNSSKNMVIL